MVAPDFEGGERFPTTNWSLVGHAGNLDDDKYRASLGRLLERYWPALKTHLVGRKRIEANLADDYVQGFIEERVLEKNLVGVASHDRGRFRNLLITSLNNYVATQMQKAGAKKRSADRALAVDPTDQKGWVSDLAQPDEAFELQWARQLISDTSDKMKLECAESKREDLWVLFEGRVLAPCLSGAEPLSYEDIIERFGFKSPTQASNALVTAKRMFARLLRCEIREYAMDETDLELELRDLEQILARNSPS